MPPRNPMLDIEPDFSDELWEGARNAIIEGLVTIVAGFHVLLDNPELPRRCKDDNQHSAAGEKLGMKHIWESLSDWKTYLAMLMYAGTNGPLYAFALFLPTIINQIGYHATQANLLTIPIYVLVSIVTCGVGFYADRKRQRGPLNIYLASAALYRIPALSYFAVYLAVCGIYPIAPNTIAWVSNNVEGSSKRSVSIVMVISFGNLNGAVSSNVYRAHDRPWYTLGHGIVLVYICLCLFTSVVYHLTLKTENAQRDRGLRDEIIDGDNDKGDAETVERQEKLNGRFASVEDAKRERGQMERIPVYSVELLELGTPAP